MDGLTLLREAESAGLRVHAEGDKLVIQGPQAAEPIALRLIEHKADVLPLVQSKTALAVLNLPHDTVPRETPAPQSDSIPTEWRRGLRQLLDMDRPNDIGGQRWQTVLADAQVFMKKFGARAAELNWSTREVWGVDRTAPAVRLDTGELVWTIRGRELSAMTEDKAVIRTKSGKGLSIYRQTIEARPNEQRLLWSEPEN